MMSRLGSYEGRMTVRRPLVSGSASLAGCYGRYERVEAMLSSPSTYLFRDPTNDNDARVCPQLLLLLLSLKMQGSTKTT